MNITRNNYEEFFMLYADNELPAAERKEVEAFIAANPDLQHELALFQQFKLTPDAAVVFTGKDALMKQENDQEAINITNYESFFILYAAAELTNNEKAAVEDFVYHHPQLQSVFELFQQVKLSPDNSIIFENKESLYRKEEDDKIVPFRWWRLAVAAMVLLIAGAFWLYRSNKDNQPVIVKNIQPVTNSQQPSLHNKEEKTSADTNSNEQPEKETIAVAVPEKEDPQAKSVQPVNAVTVSNKLRIKRNNDKTTDGPVTAIEEGIAENTAAKLKGSNISSINAPGEEAGINTVIAAIADKSVKNQQLVYVDTDENNQPKAEQVVAINNNKLEVLNTSVDTKNSLRGFFRKASRLITRKTSIGDEDSKHKSILIGGFEIAVR